MLYFSWINGTMARACGQARNGLQRVSCTEIPSIPPLEASSVRTRKAEAFAHRHQRDEIHECERRKEVGEPL